MYCVNCGKEIKDNAKFCTNCGKQIVFEQKVVPEVEEIKVNIEQVSKQKTKNKNTAPLIIGIFILLLCVGIGISVYRTWSTDKAKENLANGSYEEAADNFEHAIVSGDKTPENYIMLATSYVEMGDLYQARETLKEGYEKTQAEELLGVSIWGPMSALEIAVSSEVTPAVRQEYRFNGEEVKGYQREKGLVRLEKNYYFDTNGILIGMELNNFTEGYFGERNFGGGDFTMLSAYNEVPTNEIDRIDFDYNNFESNGVINVSWNDESFVILNVQDGLCNSIETADNESKYIISFEYDDKGRIVKCIENASDNDEQGQVVGYNISYNIDDSYSLDYMSAYGLSETIQYDKVGRELSGTGFYHEEYSWSVSWENEKIRNVYENDELIYEFDYDETGTLISAKDFRNGLETIGITYDQEDRMGYVYYIETNTGEEIKKCLDYNEQGYLANVILEYVGEGRIIFMDYEYTEDGKLLYAIKTQYDDSLRYEFEYDELGRQVGWRSIDVTYIPGTYTGTAEGWTEEIVVSVTVSAVEIISIEVIEHGETVGVGTKAFEPMIENILDANGTDVDTISGSTITSQNLINAVNDALEQAKITSN